MQLHEIATRYAYLLKLSDALRFLGDAREMQRVASRVLRESLNASRVIYSEAIAPHLVEIVVCDRAPHMPEQLGHRYSIDDLGQQKDHSFRAGALSWRNDVQADPQYTEKEKKAFDNLKIRAWANTPLVKDGGLIGMLSVHFSEPHTWTSAELAQVSETAERTWAAVLGARAQSALSESEEKYRALFNSMDEAYAVIEVTKNPEGKWDDFIFLEVNPAFVLQTGKPYPVGKTATQLFDVPDPRWAQLYGQVADTGQPIRLEEHQSALGRVFNLFIFRLGGPGSHRIAILLTNITEAHKNLVALAQSETRLSGIFARAAAGLSEISFEGRFIRVNDELCRILERSREQILKLHVLDVTHPDDHASSLQAVEQLLKTGRVRTVDKRYLRPDGSLVWASSTLTRLDNADGSPRAILAVTIDLTDRRRAAEELRESRSALQSFYDSSPLLMGIAELDGDTIIAAEANAATAAFFGRPTGSISGLPADQFAPANANTIWLNQYRLALERQAPVRFEYEHPTINGPRWLWATVAFLGKTIAGRPRFSFVAEDITDRKRAEETARAWAEERERLLQQAQHASVVKDQFLAMVSHELRTPLSAILLWAKMLKAGAVDSANHAEAIDSILRSAESQKQLVEDLLDVSRMTAGKLRLQPRPTDIAAVVRAAIEAVRLTAESKGIRILLNIQPRETALQADPDRLQQVVWNLVNNAVKFTDAGGTVEISLTSSPDPQPTDMCRITVRDTGRGIDPAFLPHVFECFRQADTSNTRTHGGLGLGLAISRQIVELHGGSIRAESRGHGHGATFIVELPCRAATSPPLPTRFETGGNPPDMLRGMPLRGLRVLLVEDDAETRTAIEAVLRKCGAEVTAFDNGRDALNNFRNALAHRPHHVLLSDIGLPEENGYHLLARLRQIEQEAKRPTPTPAIALTAYARDQDRDNALAAGFQLHISKPVDPDRLMEILQSFRPS